MVAIEKASEMFNSLGLEKFQAEGLLRLYAEYLDSNKRRNKDRLIFEVCPKCGKVHPHIIKGGMSGSGKQMYRCTECGRRFVYDTGTFSFYSHQDRDKWARFIQMTMEKDSLKKCAEALDINPSTAFYMRHKLMCYLESEAESTRLGNDVQLDEKFLKTSHKSCPVNEMDHGKQFEFGKETYSKLQVCLLTGADGDGKAYARSFNVGSAKSKDAENLDSHVTNGACFTTDGTHLYNGVIRRKNGFHKICKDCSDHEAEINLNRINSFHSSIEEFNRRYRGVKSKYVNRYAALFSLSWNLKRMRSDRDMLYKTVFNYAREYSEVIRNTELSERNIYTPEDILWRAG